MVSVPPQGARIVTPEQPMTAGRTYAISCVVWGSNPPARVEWYRGDRKDMKPIKVGWGGECTHMFFPYVLIVYQCP